MKKVDWKKKGQEDNSTAKEVSRRIWEITIGREKSVKEDFKKTEDCKAVPSLGGYPASFLDLCANLHLLKRDQRTVKPASTPSKNPRNLKLIGQTERVSEIF